MSITIGLNIAALRSARALNAASSDLSKTYQRLSSGLRINDASDDPAGLHLAAVLRRDALIANVAIQNANDAISLVRIEDSALETISNILQRMAELAQQSATGTFRNLQRSAMHAEFVALGSEIDRIAKITKFNNMTLLSNSRTIFAQVGFDAFSNSRIQIDAISATLEALDLAVGGSSVLMYSIIAATEDDSRAAAVTALAAVRDAIDNVAGRRGALGASESRLEIAVNNLQSVRENLLGAEHQIRDVDTAFEVAKMAALQITQQAASAVLAHANMQPSIALELLKPVKG
ncbi:MAG: flagellin FliC [SAR324 cluster bacterium]|uniref:Flagellin n=1 Tax=SAR324 cluster bacterium TaxID=2024889 RepID=A0A7X9IJK6_9DELT|nr:flagellin FliC [SAR324 cluster bacterium]